MVWMPDDIVTEFCTRDSEPDASNRARYHCNACSCEFPQGYVAQMRKHLVNCPSLSAATIDSIKERIQVQKTTPKRITRDPRWTKDEEEMLMRLERSLPSGKSDNKYQKMAARIGRSAQACRQKLIHLKENQAVKNGEQTTTKRVLWNRKTRSTKMTLDSDEEEDFLTVDTKSTSAEAGTYRKSRTVQRPRVTEEKVLSPTTRPRRGTSADLKVTNPDANSSKHGTTSATACLRSSMSTTTEEFLRLLRWHIHQALTKFGVVRCFYSSDILLETGWQTFVASKISSVEKDRIVARLIRLWIDGLDTVGFETEVDSEIEQIVVEMSEWTFEEANPMRNLKTMEATSTSEDDSSSAHEADSSYEDDGDDTMEL